MRQGYNETEDIDKERLKQADKHRHGRTDSRKRDPVQKIEAERETPTKKDRQQENRDREGRQSQRELYSERQIPWNQRHRKKDKEIDADNR